jgi:hypothetical protein
VLCAGAFGLMAGAAQPTAQPVRAHPVRAYPVHASPVHAYPMPAGLLPDRSATGLTSAVLDDFEDPRWPGPSFALWQVTAGSPNSPGWWPSTCQARRGSRSLWAFGGPDGGGRACNSTVPHGTATSAILKLDLTQAVEAVKLDLTFDVWLGMKPADGTGLFIYLLAPLPNGGVQRVPIFGVTGTNRRWQFPVRRLDLMNLVDITQPKEVYDLRGSLSRLEWQAIAPEGTDPGGGIFIDDVTLVWEPNYVMPTPTPKATYIATPGPSPTPRPSLTPLPSLTPAPSPTFDLATVTPGPTEPSPTFEPTDTPGPVPTLPPMGLGPIYLPHLSNGGLNDVIGPPPTDTPTPQPAERSGRWMLRHVDRAGELDFWNIMDAALTVHFKSGGVAWL